MSPQLPPAFEAALRALLRPEQLRFEALEAYGRDQTEDLCFLPQVVAFPQNAQEVSALVQLCYAHDVPITPRGAGTGLAGGALPVQSGLVLCLSSLNQILQLDKDNLQVTVEAGVITETLQNFLKEQGLYYPPDPASRGSCFIGGNINTNAGGPRAVKYGVVKDYVLNLEVVLPTGEILWTGANTLKNSTGYNLTQLLVGSEGTLGIVTKAVLKLLPYPKHQLLLLLPFGSAEKACAAVSAIFQAGIVPSALEFMERSAIDWAQAYLGEALPFAIGPAVQAHLLVEVDGEYLESLLRDCERIAQAVEPFAPLDILFADNQAQKDILWKLRRCVGHAVKSQSVYKEEDTVVPRAQLPQLLRHIKAVGSRYGFESVCYGHAGDGNLHVNILRGELSQKVWEEELPQAISEIFIFVKTLGGTISGEHGIGYVQRPYLDLVFEPKHRELFRAIKQAFDPKNLLNPEKAI